MLSFSNKFKFQLFYIVFFLPLFFINIRNSHDWGDDFAQYIKQAGNIVEGKPQTATGYIFNPDQPFLGPSVYPVGFPLIIAPVYMAFGNNMVAFNYCNTLLLCVFGLLIIYFFRKYFDELTAILLALIIIYNPWTIGFKCEINSDISFALVLLAATLIYLKISGKNIILSVFCGILVAVLVLIKNIGIVFLMAILVDSVFRVISLYWKKDRKLTLRSLVFNLLLILMIFSIVFVLFNNLLFPTGNTSLHYYKSLYTYHGIKTIFLNNVAYYIQNFQDFFHPPMELWELLPLIIKAFALTFFILGLGNAVMQKITFIEILFGGYIIAIILFPNSTQGFRYIFPVIPFIMFYVVMGLQSFRLNRQINKYVLTLGIALLCLSSYRTGLTRIIKNQSQIITGPQEPEAIGAFEYIKKNTKSNDTIVFIKPRALALYTGRYSFSNHRGQDSTSLAKRINMLKTRYFLLTSDLDNPALKNYISSKQDSMVLKFKNAKFEFYQLKK